MLASNYCHAPTPQPLKISFETSPHITSNKKTKIPY
jgi:hypothetical protein